MFEKKYPITDLKVARFVYVEDSKPDGIGTKIHGFRRTDRFAIVKRVDYFKYKSIVGKKTFETLSSFFLENGDLALEILSPLVEYKSANGEFVEYLTKDEIKNLEQEINESLNSQNEEITK